MRYDKGAEIKKEIESGGLKKLSELESEEKKFLFAEYESKDEDSFAFQIFLYEDKIRISFQVTALPSGVSFYTLKLSKIAISQEVDFEVSKDYICKTDDQGYVETIYYGKEAEQHYHEVFTDYVIDSYKETLDQKYYLENIDIENMGHC